MPKESKYGRVIVERGNIPEDEPVVIFRGQDRILPELLREYFHLCRQAGCSNEHLDSINRLSYDINEWQKNNKDRLKVPD